MNANKKGFTLIELLVVIAIIGLLATLSVVSLNNARARARDARRVSDIKQIQTALELYYNSVGTYPVSVAFGATSTIADGTAIFMSPVPTAPTPVDGNNCTSANAYAYTRTDSGASYTLTYCLGSNTGGLAGDRLSTATPVTIQVP